MGTRNHGFPKENNYLVKGDHGSIRSFQQLLDPMLRFKVRSEASNNYCAKRNHGFPRENNYLPDIDHRCEATIERYKKKNYYTSKSILLQQIKNI